MNETPSETRAAPSVLLERKLAAVVFTDVVGYSAMVQHDEAASIDRVRADAARIKEACAAHGGEFLNFMGDGLMLTFDSAIEAVTFAVEVQEGFADRNDEVPEAQRVQHRIGIHIGDVFRTTDGLLAGDGVNIAARLQTDAPPGGICISQAVCDLARGKIAFDPRFGGMRVFKNITDPVAVWHWHPRAELGHGDRRMPGAAPWKRRSVIAAGMAGVAAAAVGAGAFFLRREPVPAGPKSLAVLPFANLSDDKEAAYFADGIHEDLLTQLALLGDLKVVSRTSVMEYRNTTKKVAQIGSELKVAALVEGSVRRSGNTVRVTAQLVDAGADKHIWAANYDRDLKDVFKVQNDLAKEIANSLNVSLTAAEEKRLSRTPTQNLQAYEYYLKQQQVLRDAAGSYRAISTVNERVALLEKAVELDPQFALAWAKLGAERARSRGYGMAKDREEQAALAKQAIAKAKQLTPDDPQVKIEEAAVRLHALDDQQGAARLYEDVLRGAPYNVEALAGLAEVYGELNRETDEVQLLERAIAVDARHGVSITRLSGTYGQFRHFDRTLELRQRLVDLRPDDLDRQAGYQYWRYWKDGSWDTFDRWRATLPMGIELKVARVRNIDSDRAIARRDFAELHRLIDVDSSDWKRDHVASAQADVAALHALAWRAQGEKARATQAARQALAASEHALRDEKDFDSWLTVAQMHALLGDRQAAMSAFEKDMNNRRASGNLRMVEFRRRDKVALEAQLGETTSVIEELRRQSRRPGFYIHDVKLSLAFYGVWDHPDFVALVADPATNAPLPLDTPLVEPTR